ncbi:methylmalonyl-CoA epimerase [Sediminibacillus halophilus]|uniref:Methylmalonyl-CoA mutase, C-terminal domain n=1 Tax=Sediminibacillus halophilus TaxID=482461 RepID=A0A1G9LNN9_9BACI|nr:methylmalonyl-CoA epimerase [Sediminibacillus halophilus]SDL63464.1 methylmalonyl-CoA mutase, C-terminal domain [Sediminibacillus halophilus]
MKQIRVLIGKVGLDGHDRGALIIARALRDHGMEVIYTGLRQSPEQIAQAAVQEDVDVVGLSSLSGSHRSLFPKVVEALRSRNAADIPVIGGGVIPVEDIPYLEKKGIKKIFTSGATTDALASYIKRLVSSESISPKKIAHIGIAVRAINESLPFYQDVLGLTVEKVEKVDSEQIKVAFLKIGETRLELLEPLNEKSSIHRFLDKKGEGVHHLAFEVDDLEERLSEYRRQGIRLLNETPVAGADNSQIAFLHPANASRVLIELCQHQGKEGE